MVSPTKGVPATTSQTVLLTPSNLSSSSPIAFTTPLPNPINNTKASPVNISSGFVSLSPAAAKAPAQPSSNGGGGVSLSVVPVAAAAAVRPKAEDFGGEPDAKRIRLQPKAGMIQ